MGKGSVSDEISIKNPKKEERNSIFIRKFPCKMEFIV